MGVSPPGNRHTDSEHADMHTADRQTNKQREKTCRYADHFQQRNGQSDSKKAEIQAADKQTADIQAAEKQTSAQQTVDKQIKRSRSASLLSVVCTSTAVGNQMCRQLHTAESKQGNAQSWTSPQTAVYSRKTSMQTRRLADKQTANTQTGRPTSRV